MTQRISITLASARSLVIFDAVQTSMLQVRTFVAVFFLAVNVSAQTLVSFTFGTSGSPTTSAANVASNIGVSTFSGNLGSPATGSSPTSATAGGSGGSYFTASSWRTSDNNYFQFTITPAAGYQVSLSNVSFFYLSSSTGPNTYVLRSSADSYATNLSGSSLTQAVSTPAASDWHSTSSSVTLTFTTATTFRLLGTGASSSSGTWRVDDVTLTGTASAIPEPSTYAAIFGAAALGLAVWQRHQRTRTPAIPGGRSD